MKMASETKRPVQFLDGDAILKEIREKKREKIEKEFISNRYQRRGMDKNAGDEAMDRSQFDKNLRKLSVHSRITPRGKMQIKRRISEMDCPYCGCKTMAIDSRSKDTIYVTCTNKFCVNNAHSPLKFNALKFAAEKKFLPRRITEPMRLW